jgi:hypothetical protein
VVPSEDDGRVVLSEEVGRVVPTEDDGRVVPTEDDGRVVLSEDDGRVVPTEDDGRVVPLVDDGCREVVCTRCLEISVIHSSTVLVLVISMVSRAHKMITCLENVSLTKISEKSILMLRVDMM